MFQILIIERRNNIQRLVYECRLHSFRVDQLCHTLIDHKRYFHVNGDIGNRLMRQLLRVCIDNN